jgi:hypothetical protein
LLGHPTIRNLRQPLPDDDCHQEVLFTDDSRRQEVLFTDDGRRQEVLFIDDGRRPPISPFPSPPYYLC